MIQNQITKLVFAALSLSAVTATAQVRLRNQSEIRTNLGLNDYSVATTLPLVKVAVFDNGFMGYSPTGGTVPSTTQLIVSRPTALPENRWGGAADPHGLGMAQILWGTSGRNAEGPQMYLVNTNGLSNLRYAVDWAIENGIQVILYSQTWSFGGNFDGGGFINAIVNRATDAGILWINAAGNVHKNVYDAAIRTDDDTGELKLPGPGNTLRFKSQTEDNRVTIAVSWSDFTSDEAYATNKDLNVTLTKANGTEIELRNLIQSGQGPANDGDLHSAHAREEFTVSLGEGEYEIRIQNASNNFAESDRVRVTLSSEQGGTIDFTDATPDAGEINVVADNPNVITVGDCGEESARGPTRDGRSKPDFVLEKSEAIFTNGGRSYGTSNAAAMFAGVVATLMAAEPVFDKPDLVRYLDTLRNDRSATRCGGAVVWKTPKPSDLPNLSR